MPRIIEERLSFDMRNLLQVAIVEEESSFRHEGRVVFKDGTTLSCLPQTAKDIMERLNESSCKYGDSYPCKHEECK